MRQISLATLAIIGLLTTFNVRADDFTVTTTAFLDAGTLPTLYTCDSTNVSPEISWTNPPEKTQSYALILSDPEAPSSTFYHWLVYDIPKEVNKLPEGVRQYPAGIKIGKNDFGKTQYSGPCPPKGTVHTYTFTLYAFDNKLSLPENADSKTVMKHITQNKTHILKQLELTTVYSRWAK